MTVEAASMNVSMDGRLLVGAESDGEVSDETSFRFHEIDGMVHATYAGGRIRPGYLVGRHSGFRYVQLNTAGETSSGVSEDTVELLPDGRIRLHESWKWESRQGAGASVLEETRGSSEV